MWTPSSIGSGADAMQERKTILSPSLMCMDKLHIADQIHVLERNFDWLHYDIMDGHYCKNLALAPSMIRDIRQITDMPIDVHIMATEPETFIIDECIAGGTSHISVHPETVTTSMFKTINKIHDAGLKAGLVLNPLTTLESVEYILGRLDILTIMTIDVGFAGQKFIPEVLDKIKKAVRMREERGYHYVIQIDGGCKKDYYRQLYDAGADAYIVGNAGLFSLDRENLQHACELMHEQFNCAIKE